TPVSAFDRGIAALAQYKARTGSVRVPRGHVEALPDGTEVRLGVWVMNQKTRRTKLTTDKLTTLANLGLEWAAAEGAV
ncbi:helicase associated domain-containing protein, partial [Streptomyces sp. NPDC029674]|uniref:helicase associated domain-containing protein n=1 Tax=Streptomyces sp. NPDC029674 TaxID=3365297 RepID=UPI00384E9951